jgi:lysophospholipase L1-like esterase
MLLRSQLPGPRVWVLVVLSLVAGSEWVLRQSDEYGRIIPTLADPRLGWIKAPGRHVINKEGRAFRTNALGYRDRYWAPPAAPELPVTQGGQAGLRVAVFGDSMTHGPGCEEADLWPRQLEVSLQAAAPEREVLVMNFAVVGYVFEQMVRIWEDYAHAWKPDLVIICVNAWSARPMRFLEPLPGGPLAKWLRSTAIYNRLQRFPREEASRRTMTWAPGRIGDGRSQSELEKQMRKTPLREAYTAYWGELLTRLQRLNDEVEEQGGHLILLSIPRLEAIAGDHSRWSSDRWDGYADEVGARHFNLLPSFQEGMAEILAEAEAHGGIRKFFGARAGDAAQRQLVKAPTSLYRFSDPEHLAARGHRLVAQELLSTVQELFSCAD